MHGLVAVRLSGVLPSSRTVFWSQDLFEPTQSSLGQKMIYLFKKCFLPACPLVIAPSRTRAEALKKFFRLSVEPVIVYNSPRLNLTAHNEHWRERLGIGPATPIIVYVGGLGADRCVPELVESVAFWPQNVELLMAGYGRPDMVEQLKGIARRAGVENRVHWVGHLPAIFDLVSEAQLGCSFFPSDRGGRNEEFRGIASNKIFEYLAMGKPVITTANPETMDVVGRNECGTCVADHSPRSIARTVSVFLDDPALLERVSRNATLTHQRETHFEKRFLPTLKVLEAMLTR